MIILVILLVLFGVSIQFVLANTHKRNIVRKDYIALNVILYLDFIATTAFILSVHYDAPIAVKLVFEYLVFLCIGVNFLFYMPVIKSVKQKRKWFTFLTGFVGITIVFIMGPHVDKTTTLLILFLILLSRLILVDVKKRYPSKYIQSIVLLLYMTEVIRFVTEGLITSDLLYHDFSDIWLSAFSFILRAITTLFIIILHEQLSINKNLAKTLDYQSASVLLSQVFDQNPNVVILTDMNRKIVYVNQQATIVTGYSENEIIGQTPKMFRSKFTPKETYDELNEALKRKENWLGEFINKKKNGDIFVEQVKIMTLKDVNGVPVFYLAIKTDVTTEKAYLKELEYRSYHDDLTGLLRRQVFLQKLEEKIEKTHRKNHHFILMDVDEFKHINDSYGHLVGDDILIMFSNMLKEAFKERAHICRFGGDEFALYLYDYETEYIEKMIRDFEEKLKTTQITVISEDYRLRFSYGLVPIHIPLDFSYIYETADKKLYLNKGSKNKQKQSDN